MLDEPLEKFLDISFSLSLSLFLFRLNIWKGQMDKDTR